MASAPAIFQQIMDQILPQREGIICYLDDILITGKNDHEHLQNLEAVLKRLEECNLRIKKPKCCFFQDKVEFLGKVVTKEGIAEGGSSFKNTTTTESYTAKIISGDSQPLQEVCSIVSRLQ